MPLSLQLQLQLLPPSSAAQSAHPYTHSLGAHRRHAHCALVSALPIALGHPASTSTLRRRTNGGALLLGSECLACVCMVVSRKLCCARSLGLSGGRVQILRRSRRGCWTIEAAVVEHEAWFQTTRQRDGLPLARVAVCVNMGRSCDCDCWQRSCLADGRTRASRMQLVRNNRLNTHQGNKFDAGDVATL